MVCSVDLHHGRLRSGHRARAAAAPGPRLAPAVRPGTGAAGGVFGQPDLADRARGVGTVGGRAVLAGHRAGQLARLPAVRVGSRPGRRFRGNAAGSSAPAIARAQAGGRRRAAIVQRGCDRRIIDLASGVRWERLTPQSEAMTDFLEVIYSPGGHSTDERRPLRHDGREYGLIISGTLHGQRRLRELRAGPGRLDRVRFLDAARVPQQDRRRRARDLGRRAFRARPRLTPWTARPGTPACPKTGHMTPPVPPHGFQWTVTPGICQG